MVIYEEMIDDLFYLNEINGVCNIIDMHYSNILNEAFNKETIKNFFKGLGKILISLKNIVIKFIIDKFNIIKDKLQKSFSLSPDEECEIYTIDEYNYKQLDDFFNTGYNACLKNAEYCKKTLLKTVNENIQFDGIDKKNGLPELVFFNDIFDDDEFNIRSFVREKEKYKTKEIIKLKNFYSKELEDVNKKVKLLNDICKILDELKNKVEKNISSDNLSKRTQQILGLLPDIFKSALDMGKIASYKVSILETCISSIQNIKLENKYEYFRPNLTYDTAIKNKETGVLKALLVNTIGSDPTFITSEYEEANDYIKYKSKQIHGEVLNLSEPYELQDGEYTKSKNEGWDEEYFGLLLVWYRDNYADKRLPIIKEVGKEVYKNKLTFGKSKYNNHLKEKEVNIMILYEEMIDDLEYVNEINMLEYSMKYIGLNEASNEAKKNILVRIFQKIKDFIQRVIKYSKEYIKSNYYNKKINALVTKFNYMKEKYKDSNKYFVAAIPNNLFDNFCSDIEKFINCFKPMYKPEQALYRNANLDIQIIEKTIQDQENKFKKYVSQRQEFTYDGFYHYIDSSNFLKPKKYKLSEFDILYKKLDNQNAYFIDLYDKFENLCFHNKQIPNIDNFENDEYDFLSKYYNYVLRYTNICFQLCSTANRILNRSLSSFVDFDEEDFDEEF